MMSNIAIIGAGNIGSRHLQGLKNLPQDAHIYVIDPYAPSLETSETRWKETGAAHNVIFSQDITPDLKTIDCAIMASSADSRATMTRKLLDHADVKSIIFEKVLFQDADDYNSIPQLLAQKNIAAWVNCPRRLWPVYKSFFAKTGAPQKVHLKITGSSWGLACNAIHMIDLLSWLSGETHYKMTEANLDPKIISSKRPGFVEFTGSFAGEFRNGSTFMIESSAEQGTPYALSLSTGNISMVVHEDSDHYDINTGDGWKTEKLVMPYQSQLSGDIVKDILISGTCALTPFSDSVALHTPLISMFLEHYNSINGGNSKICPIT